MAILNKIYPALLALALSSCYSDFNPHVDTTPVLCVNSCIIAGQPIEVEVSRSWLYTDEAAERDHSVSDATVRIYADGRPVDASYIPREGERISIQATSSTYGEATAEVMVPHSVPVADLSYTLRPKRIGVFYAGPYTVADITFDIDIKLRVDDPAAVMNYYRYECMGYTSFGGEGLDEEIFGAPVPPDYVNCGNLVYEAEPIFSEHIGVLEAVSGSDAWGFTFFTDRQFSGKSYTLNLRYTDAEIHLTCLGDQPAENFGCGFELQLYSVSESYYNLANYCWQMDSGLIGDMSDIGLGEPQWGYSNVSTSAGVVVAEAPSVRLIDLTDFVRQILRDNPPQQ